MKAFAYRFFQYGILLWVVLTYGCAEDTLAPVDPVGTDAAQDAAQPPVPDPSQVENGNVAPDASAGGTPYDTYSGSSSGGFDLSASIVYFDYDQHSVKSESRPVLEQLAQYMRSQPNERLRVEGHCDERGSTEYNLALGQRRAEAVRRYLINLGVDGGQLTSVSFGEEMLRRQGFTAADHAQNRRVEFSR
ncbi:MAG: OmpA family protein [Pseudobacteriovorax sp.]|nr:OmpA family protein [Pseudobacteriovorax sp.]